MPEHTFEGNDDYLLTPVPAPLLDMIQPVDQNARIHHHNIRIFLGFVFLQRTSLRSRFHIGVSPNIPIARHVSLPSATDDLNFSALLPITRFR